MKPSVMKRRLLVFTFLMVPMMASAQPADWQTVVGSDLRFRLEMPAPATKTARLVFSALQGALLVKRTTGDMAQFKDVIAVLKAELTPPATRGSARRS